MADSDSRPVTSNHATPAISPVSPVSTQDRKPEVPTMQKSAATADTAAVSSSNSSTRDPDSVDPLDTREAPHVTQPVVSLDPGQRVTIVPNGQQHADSAVVITAPASDTPTGQPQRPEPDEKGARTQHRGCLGILKDWLGELLACLLAVLMLVAEVVLLIVYHDKPTYIWQHHWQINSVFAFLTALLEAAVAFAVGSCLGEIRWLWFAKGNKELLWMDRLTNARAAPGALHYLVSKGAWKHWATLGALLIVALLGTSVFTQLIITQVTGKILINAANDPVDAPSVPISNTYYDNWQYGDKPGDEQPLVPMVASVESGFVLPSSVNDADNVLDLVSCQSGNCTFAEYSSLAVCYKCANISQSIVVPCNKDPSLCPANATMFLPDNSLSLNLNNGYVNITSDTTYPNASLIPNVGPLIARYKGLASYDFPQTPPYAVECAVYWCVQTWNSSMVSNNFSETTTETWTNLSSTARTQYGQTSNITLTPDHCYVNGSRAVSNSSGCLFAVDATSHRALQNYLVGDSSATGFLSGSAVTLGNDTNYWAINGLAANVIQSPCQTEVSCTGDAYNMFEWALSNMTSYMTNNLRKVVDTGPGFTYGIMTLYEPHYHVRWGWLAYPIAVVIVSLLFVFITIYESRNAPIWKTSVMALMFHGFQHDDSGIYEKMDDPKEMAKATRKWSVSLVDLDGTKTFKRMGSVRGKRRDDVLEEPTHGIEHFGKGIIDAYGSSN